MIIFMLKRRVKENQVFNGGTKLWVPQRLAASVVIELAWYRAFLHVYGKCETDGFLLSLHVLPFICNSVNVDEHGIFHVANFVWGLRLLQWSNPLFFKCDCFCVMERSLTSQIVQPFWGGWVEIVIFVVLFTRDCSCIAKRFATLDVFGYPTVKLFGQNTTSLLFSRKFGVWLCRFLLFSEQKTTN